MIDRAVRLRRIPFFLSPASGRLKARGQGGEFVLKS
jgi:hypothetical protein